MQTPSKAAHTAPKITESYVADDGEVMHVLDNGREQSETSYNAIWHVPKGVINWKTKGPNPDRTKIS